MSNIKDTKLFKKLKKLDQLLANDVLKNSNSIIELINKKTTINFPNYTNHDIRHSITLMNTMYEIIKDNKDFSALEYALMIYSAIFHDIGMAISDDEINKIKNNDSKYLYNQDFKLIKENLFDNEQLAIQEVIRNAHGKIANDLITTEYKELFKLPERNTYFDVHLGMICQAHTEDKSYLEKIPTEKTKGDYDYNARFIAILLRVSDILDIDDTRTPIELYNSIDLNDYSDEEWQKNFVIENSKKIFKRNKLKEIRLEGSCENIKVHRKLLNYIKWIENELVILVNETSDMQENYQIQINTEVKNNIEPKGYTIPDLKLNMDYHVVTNLLMGEAIYGSKDLGLRELLQNSIDAIMLKKDKLAMENHPLKNSYEPMINIVIDKENNKVIISDNGMGMDEYIIKNYFLNVGKSYYKSKDFINFNHNYNPIGNFGIGFLSCFMLSNEVKVITKYWNLPKKYIIDLEKSSEYIAFKIEKENDSYESGTKIILNLKKYTDSLKSNNQDIIQSTISFIQKYLLIYNFKIKVNGFQIPEFLEPKESKRIIRLEKYSNKFEGYIKINYQKNKVNNNLHYLVKNANLTFYLNDENIQKINDLSRIDIDKLIHKNKIYCCLLPIINKEYSNEINEKLIKSRSLRNKNKILSEIKENKFILLLLDKNYATIDNKNMDTNIGFLKRRSTKQLYNLNNLCDLIPELKNLYIPLFQIKVLTVIGHEKEYIYTQNLSLKPRHLQSNFYTISIKNIKLQHIDTNILLPYDICVNKINVNITDDFKTNINRTKLLKDDEFQLINELRKIILKYAIEENFIASRKKDLVLKLFID